MQIGVRSSEADARLTSVLLGCGIAAGPTYIIVALLQVLMREGFDVRRHALSLLANGELGWIQMANLLVSGALVLAGAVGARRLLGGNRGARWGPILLAGYGLGLMGAGIFVPDPAQGFPPGAVIESSAMSRSGLLHFVFGGIGFYALIAACVVFARRFASLQRRGWAAYSAFTALAFFITFAAVASGSKSVVTMLSFYGAVAWIWVWHAAFSRTLLSEVTGAN